MADRLECPGNYDVGLTCPSCGQTVVAYLELDAVLTVASDGPAVIKTKVTTRAVEHRCGQGELFGLLDEADEDER